MTRIAWHPLASRELFEASAHYDGESRGLGQVFLDAIDRTLDLLRDYPRLGRIVLGNARALVVTRFPYSVVYRLRESPKPESVEIFILAVGHHKRRPRYWARRL